MLEEFRKLDLGIQQGCLLVIGIAIACCAAVGIIVVGNIHTERMAAQRSQAARALEAAGTTVQPPEGQECKIFLVSRDCTRYEAKAKWIQGRPFCVGWATGCLLLNPDGTVQGGDLTPLWEPLDDTMRRYASEVKR